MGVHMPVSSCVCVSYTRGCLAVHCWDTCRVPDAAVWLLCCSLVLSVHSSLSAGHWTCAVKCGCVNRARPVLCVCPLSRTVSAHDNCSSFGCSGMLRALAASVAVILGCAKQVQCWGVRVLSWGAVGVEVGSQ